jgi:hypothetical protein
VLVLLTGKHCPQTVDNERTATYGCPLWPKLLVFKTSVPKVRLATSTSGTEGIDALDVVVGVVVVAAADSNPPDDARLGAKETRGRNGGRVDVGTAGETPV